MHAWKSWKWAAELALHFFVGGALITLLFLPWGGPVDSEILLQRWFYSGVMWVAIGYGNGWLAEWLNKKIPWLEAPLRRSVVSGITSLGYTLAVTILIDGLLQVVLFQENWRNILLQIRPGFLFNVGLITLVISLFLHGRSFLFAWRDSHLEADRLKRAHLASRYESLRNQVNPHFLFNSFNVLSSLVYKDQDLAARFIKQLAQVYRYVLDTGGEELTPLSRELEALESYLFLLKIRFSDNLQVDVNLQPQSGEYLAPLSLQMLVENAVKHNIASRAHPLSIRVERCSDGYILVSNTIQLRLQEGGSLGIGLPNIQERYGYLTTRPVRIEPDNGLFRVFLPIIYKTEDHASFTG